MSIIKAAGTSYREGANYVINPNHPSTVVENAITTSKIYRYYISGSTPIIDTGVANAGYTAIDNKNYVDTTTGTLSLVGGAYWSIQRVFWVPNSPTNAFIVYYGNDRYRSMVDAVNAKDSEPFTEAPNTAQNAIFIGYIIIQGGGSGTPARDLLNASETTIIPSGLFRSVGGVGSSGTTPLTTELSGLSDVSVASRVANDLLIYNGSQWVNSKILTGNYSINGNLTVTGSLIGTASVATTASYVLQAVSASYATTALSSSFAATASFVNPLNQQLTITGSLRGQVSALSISSNTASINMSTNNFFTLTLVNGAGTNINPTNINPGQTVNILVTQGSAGTGTVTFPSLVKQPSGSLYTGSAVSNAIDIVTMIAFDSTNVYVSSVRNMI